MRLEDDFTKVRSVGAIVVNLVFFALIALIAYLVYLLLFDHPPIRDTGGANTTSIPAIQDRSQPPLIEW